MIRLAFFLALLLPTAALGADAPPAPDSAHLVEIHVEREIDAPAELVWQILAREFVSVDEWSRFVKSSRALTADDAPDGVVVAANAPIAGRETKTRQLATEFLVMYSEEDRSFTFQAGTLPKFLSYADDTQRVIELDDGRSLVTFDLRVVPVDRFATMGPMINKRMSKAFAGVLKDLEKAAVARLD